MALILIIHLSLSPCGFIREKVSQYGIEATVSWAKAHGYSDTRIAQIRKVCHI